MDFPSLYLPYRMENSILTTIVHDRLQKFSHTTTLRVAMHNGIPLVLISHSAQRLHSRFPVIVSGEWR